jgi:uncharacterized DUF497 family protein
MPEAHDLTFEWDHAKSTKNLADRGFDFEFASRIFDGDTMETEDTRRAYGEPRFIAVGQIDDEFYVVVYTQRGDVRRIISARLASRRERNDYREAFASRNP